MKKALSMSLVFLMLGLLLVACSNNANNAKSENNAGNNQNSTVPPASAEPSPPASNIKGKITMLTNRTDLVETKYKEYAAAFKEKYPEADVEFEALKDYPVNLKVRLASRELPDVVILPTGTLTKADMPEFFAPLDDLGLNDKILFKDTGTFDGKLYRIASGVNAKGIVYNKKVFEAAGISVPLKTIDEFYSAAEKLKANGVIPFATNFKEKWPLGEWRAAAIVASGDVQYLNKMIESDGPFTMDSPLGKSLTILRTLVEKGCTEPDLMSTNWEASKKDVASGKIAMYLLANWVVPQIIENGGVSEEIGMMPMPMDNSGNLGAYLMQDLAYTVNKDSKNIETAKAFVKFLIEESDYADFSGFIPVLKDRKASLPQLEVFMSYNPQLMEDQGLDEAFITIQNKAQIDWPAFFQDAIVHQDMGKVFDDYNKKWADARKTLK